MSNHYTEEAMLARYRELCAVRDEVNHLNQGAEGALAAVSAQIIELQAKERELAAAIDARRLEANWIPLKKEIATLAKVLGRPDGPLATKD